MTVGEIVKRERIAKGFSMRVFAKKAEISLATLVNVESGKHVPTNGTMKSIAEALDMRPSDIMLEVVGDMVKRNDASGKRGW